MFGKTKYFYRLFFAFLLTSILPLALLSLFFGLFSARVLEGSYRQQSEATIKNVTGAIDHQLAKFSHLVYILSQNEEIIITLEAGNSINHPNMLNLYQTLYSSIAGHIDNAALHIISLNGLPSYSTQQIPDFYIDTPKDSTGGIFLKASKEPEKTVLSLNNYLNNKGELVALSLCKSIRTEEGKIIGFVVLDIYKSYLSIIADRINRGFFSELLLVDPTRNLVSDLYHPENDGNFSHLPFLIGVTPFRTGLFIKNERMISYNALTPVNISIAGTVALNVVMTNLSYLVNMTLWFLLICLILSILIAVLISRSISQPVKELIFSMSRVEDGDLDVRIESPRKDEIGILFNKFNIMTEQIQKLMKETLEEQNQLLTAERKALLAQINPHFLYNTLNTIKSISKLEGIDNITTIVTQLGKLLRSTIENDQEFVTLGTSIELVKSYLAIQKIRFGDKIQTLIELPENLKTHSFPKLILQPLIENAVIHGLEPKVGGGKIVLKVSKQNKEIKIEISDTGIGMTEPLKAMEDNSKNSIGLHNVHRRLQLYYGKDYGINIESSLGKGTKIVLVIPMEEDFIL